MWLSLIVSGAIHGLILLPVALSYAGGPGYSLDDFDEEWVCLSPPKSIALILDTGLIRNEKTD